MAPTTDKQLVNKIIELVGGKDNILSGVNCMTRLRLRLKDSKQVDLDGLKNTQGVLGVVDAETMQIVVGPGKAAKLINILRSSIDNSKDQTVSEDWKANKEAIMGKGKDNLLKSALETIAGIFIPMIPAIIAAGIFNSLASLISTLLNNGTLSASTFWAAAQLMSSLFGSGFLAYFAIFTGINAARRFGASEALGGMLGAISITAGNQISQLFNMYNAELPVNSILTTGRGGVIGVIIGVYILSLVEKRIRKAVPDILDLVVTPLVSLLVTGMLFVFVIMPVTGFISDGLVGGLNLLLNSGSFLSVIAGYTLSALFLPMVLQGLHHGLTPLYALQLEALGGITLFPVLAMAGAGQVGAVIAIYIKACKVRNNRIEKIIAGALPAGILGVGEPLIYGVTLPLGKPFVTAGLGAGFGGAFVTLTNVMASAWGPSGVVAIAVMQPASVLNYLLGLVIAYIFSFLLTYAFVKDSEVANV